MFCLQGVRQYDQEGLPQDTTARVYYIILAALSVCIQG